MGQWHVIGWLEEHPGWHRTGDVATGLGFRRRRGAGGSGHMVSHKIMLEFSSVLKEEPQSMRELCRKLNRPEGSVRAVLTAMEALGLVEKVSINRPSTGKRPTSVGWKTPTVSNSLSRYD